MGANEGSSLRGFGKFGGIRPGTVGEAARTECGSDDLQRPSTLGGVSDSKFGRGSIKDADLRHASRAAKGKLTLETNGHGRGCVKNQPLTCFDIRIGF